MGRASTVTKPLTVMIVTVTASHLLIQLAYSGKVILLEDAFIVGDRVKTRFRVLSAFSDPAFESRDAWSDVWSAGTIMSLDGKVAIVAFDDLAAFPVRSLRYMAWRIERLEFEGSIDDLGEDYFW